ncbi:DNA polymerase III subunit gamma and tau [Brachybacterium alimentarium]|uniref:DNA polymerase III subunit gamma and tau n=1 Tax=Brachybacterium alimentarium TaxID=47845 RepID=UPI003FD61C6B
MATALYRRYRPESFAEVIGQDHVTTPLRRALRAGRIGHAYLFSGPRGCGKTTSARILARCLNCAEGPTDTPCGQCDSCRDLATGGSGSLDVVEIDAASHGGVDDARELRERASFAPVRDRYKVFIIDEAHMVTSAGFNALLKLVEEPPDHVKFVFATTEPDKVIGTIRSRTHHYPFRLIPPQVLAPYLEEVCAAEGVNVGEGVMPLVVRAGGGSARDSMSVLDQLMAGAAEGGLDMATAIALLGFTDTALLDTAITAVAERDAAALYGAVEHVLATGHEPRRFVEDLLERMRDLIVLAAVPDRGADLLPQVPADDLERMRTQATLFAPADLSQCGDLVHETLSTMSGATSPRLHLELLAARLVLRDERAALAAPAEGAAPAGGRPAPAQNTRGATAQPGASAPAPGGAGGREEARRIAQEKAEAARQARGGRPQGARPEQVGQQPGGQPAWNAAQVSQAAQTAQAPQAPQAPQEPASSQDPNAAPAQASEPARQYDRADSASAQADRAPAQGQSSQASWGTATEDQQAGPDARGAASAPQQPAPEVRGAASAPQPQQDVPSASEDHGQPQYQDSGQVPAPSPAQVPAAGGVNPDDVREHWSAILDELSQIRRPSWALVSQNAHVHGAQGTTLVLGFRTEGLVSAFHRGTAAENLADAVRRILHTEITVDAVVGEDPGPGGGSGGGGGSGAPGPGGGSRPGPGASQAGSGNQGGQAPGTAQGQSGPPVQQAPQGGPRQGAGPGGGPGGAPRWGDAVTPTGSAPPASAPSAAVPSAMPATPATASAPSAPASAPSASTPAWPEAASVNGPGSASGGASASAAPASASSASPSGQEAPQASVGQRAADRAMQAAARASQNRASQPGVPDRVEDFAPEPDDPYPPDPEDGYGRTQPVPQVADSTPPSGHLDRWSDALAPQTGAAPAAPGRQGQAPSAGPDGNAGALQTSGEIPEVEDAGRDSLPPEEPRTYGQNALRRAIAEGRVVRSIPARGITTTQDPAPAQALPSGHDEPSDHTEESSPSAPSATAAPPQEPAQNSAAPQGSASARAAASWGAPSAASAAPTPAGSSSPPAGPPSSPEPARSGAALVREAAHASRSAGLRTGRGTEPEPVESDPTGGATRDDDDAVVATRNGREVIESVLGGKVLEVIDETERY